MKKLIGITLCALLVMTAMCSCGDNGTEQNIGENGKLQNEDTIDDKNNVNDDNNMIDDADNAIKDTTDGIKNGIDKTTDAVDDALTGKDNMNTTTK